MIDNEKVNNAFAVPFDTFVLYDINKDSHYIPIFLSTFGSPNPLYHFFNALMLMPNPGPLQSSYLSNVYILNDPYPIARFTPLPKTPFTLKSKWIHKMQTSHKIETCLK